MKIIKVLKKFGKWTAISIGGIIALILIVVLVAYWVIERRMHKFYPTDTVNIVIPADSLSIVRGEHLFAIQACTDCHASDLGGKVMADDPMIGKFIGRNLTKGKGGLPDNYTDQDWLRALKNGVGVNGRPLVGMPSDEFTKMPDQDIADIIAYCKSHEPVDRVNDEIKVGPVIRLLAVLGKVKLIAAEEISREVEYIEKPEIAASVQFGATLAVNCFGCHGGNLQGGPSPIPGMPVVPDISSTGRVGSWTDDQFMQTLKTGTTPDGHAFKNEEMPWERFKSFSDVELKALRAYLISFPKK